MASPNLKTFIMVIVTFAAFWVQVSAIRNFNQRSDLQGVPPPSDSGWTVPLQGGITCTTSTNCSNSLPPPSSSKILKVLAFGRGTLTYDCDGVDPSLPPLFKSQLTTLLDAAPLIPFLADEDALHNLVPQLYSYDYASLDNTTLICIGRIFTDHEEQVVELDNLDSFSVHVEEAINAPEDPVFNERWAHSLSTDGTWDVYRVETFGGAQPLYCAGQNETITIGYASEYWFYHA